ncbi:hypothetical protein FB558_5631 [Pseudonocardia kunmingensis]|uniref:Uncharacterized protein n=1 Tax=Pseudonocardia kunmingensis TaxID=630975 RepID=A0A543DKK0_9PSEU|nr:hypothetical protein FB558_5631 [Pseudonocardia kunmingensis]
MTRGHAVGVARLVLLLLAAVGFLAMHGLAATDPLGAHHTPITTAGPTTEAATMEHMAGGDRTAPTAAAHTSDPRGGEDGHAMMAACVFVLISALAGVALRALFGGVDGTPPTLLRITAHERQRPRAPPHPIFLSLCVFRL